MIEIHLYGKLRNYSGNNNNPGEGILRVEVHSGDTIHSLLMRLGIPDHEINHVFLNSKLLATRNSHPELYDLPQANAHVQSWDLDTKLNVGDRLGLFGLDIPMLSM